MLAITPDGRLLGRCDGEVSFKAFLGATSDLLKNIHGVASVAELDSDEIGYLLAKVAGNHEEMMLRAPHVNPDICLNNGGFATLESYDIADDLQGLPVGHRTILESLRPYHETATRFFVHANYQPDVRLEAMSQQTMLWRPLDIIPAQHCSGKTAVVGHTRQKDNRILNAGHLLCIDTACGYGGALTTLHVDTGKIWQAEQCGILI
jgi:serine/threonine protein phosphatase 1